MSSQEGIMKTVLQFHEEAEFLRESSGSNIEKALNKAVKVLALFQIPHYVCGGFAVQEHGYPRFTVDVDLIVPDVDFAREKLAMNGFKENPSPKMTVTDRETQVEIDLSPGGSKVDPGPLTFPVPTHVSSEPQILTLAGLLSLKLSTYIGRGVHRIQDYADVVKLIEANDLPRDYNVDAKVRDTYREAWDEIHSARIVCSGSLVAARHAGRALAIIPVSSNRVAALQYVKGSLLLMPYSKLVRRRDNRSAPQMLTARPDTTGSMALCKITDATLPGVAPSANRIPISLARRADV
jgi:hypothetical protein